MSYARDDIEVLQHLLTLGLEFHIAGEFDEADVLFRLVSSRLSSFLKEVE